MVKVFKRKADMQAAYDAANRAKGVVDGDNVQGVHLGYTRYGPNGDGTYTLHPESGTVLLYFGSCGAGVVSHEFMHAVLWAVTHQKSGDDPEDYCEHYPIIIDNMDQEEVLLHNLTYAVRQFYNWLYKIEKVFQ